MMRALLLASVGLLSVGTAHADTFTEAVQFGPGPADHNSSTGTTAGPGTTQLYYFDSSGGTLSSITFSYAYSVSSLITVNNTSSTASSGNASIKSAPQFTSSASAVTAALNAVVNNYVDPVDGTVVTLGSRTVTPIAADVRGTATSYALAPGASTSFISSGSYGRPSYTITDPSVLAAFSQSGISTFTPLFTTLTGLAVSNSGGNTTAGQMTTAQGNLVLSYNYTTGPAATPPASNVPEPASLALLGMGMAGVAVTRRRRRAG